MKGISEVILKFCEKFTCITLSVVFIFYFFNKHPGQIKQLVLTSTHPKTGWGLEEYINIFLACFILSLLIYHYQILYCIRTVKCFVILETANLLQNKFHASDTHLYQ